jgi:signal transduction histidine kinase
MKTIILFLVIATSCFAQNKIAIPFINHEDSLKKYSQSLNDSLAIDPLINYCFSHKNEIPELAFKYSQVCLQQSKKLKLNYCEARSLTNLGAIDVQRANYASALKYYMEALVIWEKLHYKKGIMFNKNNIAQVYGNLNKPDLQFRFLNEASKIAVDNSFEDGMALINDNLSIYYYLKNDLKSAFSYVSKAIAINLKINKLSDACRCYSNAGDFLSNLHKEDSAILYFNIATQIAKKINDNYVIALCYANLAATYYRTHQIDTSIVYHKKAIDLSKQIGEKDNLLIEYHELAKIYKEKKDFEKALDYTILGQQMKDSITSIASLKQVSELQTKYDTQKKDIQILEQNIGISKRNYLIVASVFLLLTLSLFAIIFYRRYKWQHTMELEKSVLEQKAIAIEAVFEAEEKERRRIAQDLHDNMGAHTTSILAQIDELNYQEREPVNNKYNTLRTDAENIMAMLRETIWILKTKTISIHNFYDLVKSYANKQLYQTLNIRVVFNEKLDVQKQLSPTMTLNLYRIVQETIQNIIKHAYASVVEFNIETTPQLKITITDNGKGFDMNSELNKSGLENMQFRADEINFVFTTISEVGKGTTICLNEKT